MCKLEARKSARCEEIPPCFRVRPVYFPPHSWPDSKYNIYQSLKYFGAIVNQITNQRVLSRSYFLIPGNFCIFKIKEGFLGNLATCAGRITPRNQTIDYVFLSGSCSGTGADIEYTTTRITSLTKVFMKVRVISIFSKVSC